jgi:L-lactate dehydrogenase complex protein LldG
VIADPVLKEDALPQEQLVAEFVREAEVVGARTVRVSRDDIAGTLAVLLKDERSVVAAAGLEGIVEELQARGIKVVSEDGSGKAAEALPTADAGLGQAIAGVSASGTILIGPGSGLEGLIATLPPRYVVLLPANIIQPDVGAALALAAPLIAGPGSRVAFITGPSRTSDIEMTSVIGVHGPMSVDIVIVNE